MTDRRLSGDIPRCWLFQALQDIYDIDGAAASMETDLLPTDGKDLSPEDVVIVWRGQNTPRPAGVIAIAIVEGSPQATSDESNSRWRDSEEAQDLAQTVRDRVVARYFVPSGLPLLLDGPYHRLLSRLPVGNRGAMFEVSADLCRSILRLAEFVDPEDGPASLYPAIPDPDDDWAQLKRVTARFLVKEAASRRLTTDYSNLAAWVTSHSLVEVKARSAEMNRLLEDVCRDEWEADRPLLTSVVVHTHTIANRAMASTRWRRD